MSTGNNNNLNNLCHVASFSAENTPIAVIPAFNFSSNLPLLSSPSQDKVGPFRAGLPTDVPLWMAKLLHQRQLGQIQLPKWLTTENLAELLQQEKDSTVLTNKLPFYYYEIARALNLVVEKSTQVVLQDLVAVRIDKIRQHFHDLSRNDLSQGEMHMIMVTGMGSIELNKVGPFLKQAFSDYGYLIRKSNTKDGIEGGQQVGGASMTGGVGGEDGTSGEKIVQESQRAMASTTRNKLRRFRGTQ